jgi:3-methyladenine DNA glycosylase AlkD
MNRPLTAKAMHDELRALGDKSIAEHSTRFFKAGPGEYGEGDRFLGIRVPILRRKVREFRGAPLRAILSLLKSEWHEERLFAVLALVQEYKRGLPRRQAAIFDAYLAHSEYVNNWDLVDSSAHFIVGPQLEAGSRALLGDLARSELLWERRIAMMSTYHYIRNEDYEDAIKIAILLQDDEHDLIHKVVGWMLREIGNRDIDVEEKFLQSRYKTMPRTMLRYAIEKFPEPRRKAYLHGTV